jgi:hypothetical protein
MDTVLIYTLVVTVLYAILCIFRNKVNPENAKSPKDIAIDSLLAGSATFSSYYLLSSLGYATITPIQKGGSTVAFTSKPEF